jgi:hypothetical protein
MNEVVLDMPGETAEDLMKPKKKQRWDKTKKNFVQAFVDPEGHIIKDKQKTGKKTTQKLQDKYKRWKRQTHVRIQDAGESEDTSIVEGARTAFRSRKDAKMFHGQKKDKDPTNERRPRRNELKNAEEILKDKKREMKKKHFAKGKGKGKPNPAAKFARSQHKISLRSRPSRSKMILT